MKEEITRMQHVFLSGERNMLKTPKPTCINQLSKDVLQFLCSIELTLQAHNLSLCPLKASNPYVVKIFLGLSSHFLELLPEELALII